MSNSGLPDGWEMDYDGKRWFYTYKATGLVQYKWPQPGDEFPDFFDPAGPEVPLPPEDRLAIQQQQTKKPDEPRKTFASGMSATGGPMAYYDNEEFGNTEFFQPDALMYMGPGAYNEVSPIGNDDIEQPSSNVAELPVNSTSIGTGAKVSPIASEKSTPMTQHSRIEAPAGTSFAARMTESLSTSAYAQLPISSSVKSPPLHAQQPAQMHFEIQMLHGHEIQTSSQRRAVGPNPIGFIAEMPTEFTALAPVDTAPIEMGDDRVLAPIETEVLAKSGPAIRDIAELPSASIDPVLVDQTQQQREKIRSQQRPYGERQYPFQPHNDAENEEPHPTTNNFGPELPPKIPHDEASTVPSTTSLGGQKLQPFKPSVGSLSSAKPSNHARRPSEIKNHRLLMLASGSKHLLHISPSQPHLRFPPNSNSPPNSAPPSPPKPPKMPIPPTYQGSDQPPIALQPGILVENLVLPPVVQAATKQPSPPRLPALPYGPTNNPLPYPVDDYSYGHDAILDMQPACTVPPHVRTHRSASMSMAPPVSLWNGGSLASSTPNHSMPSFFVQPQQAPYQFHHQQLALAGDLAALRASADIQSVPPLHVNVGAGIVRPSTTVPYPSSQMPRMTGHSQMANHDSHIPGSPGHGTGTIDINHHRRPASGVSALSSPSLGPQSAGGILAVSSVSSTTLGSHFDSSSGRRHSVSQSGMGNSSDRQSEYFPPQASSDPFRTVLPVPLEATTRRQSLSLVNEIARQRLIKRRPSMGTHPSVVSSTSQSPLTYSPRVRSMSMLADGEAALLTPSPEPHTYHSQSLHAIKEVPLPRPPPVPPKTPIIEKESFVMELPDKPKEPTTPDIGTKGSQVRPQKQIVKSMLLETDVANSTITPKAPRVTSVGAALAPPLLLLSSPSHVTSQIAGKTRPVSLPPPSRTSTLISVQAHQPKPMQQHSPPAKEPKEKSRWLSKIFKGHKRKVSPSFKLFNATPNTTTSDPVNFPVGWEDKSRSSHDSTAADGQPGPPSPAHQDGLRSHAPFPNQNIKPGTTSASLTNHLSSSSIEITVSAPTKSQATSYTDTNTTPWAATTLTTESHGHHHTLHEMPIIHSPPSVSITSREVPSPLSQAVSRNTSGRSVNYRSSMPCELGVPKGDFFDGVSDQASVSTMDISEARIQPVLRPQLVQVPSATTSISSNGHHVFTSSNLGFEMPANNEPKALLSDDAIAPLALRKKTGRQSLPTFPLESQSFFKTSGLGSNMAFNGAEDDRTPTQALRRTSRNDVLEAELIDVLFAKDAGQNTNNGGLFMAELEAEPLSPPTNKQSEYSVAPLSTPPRSRMSTAPRTGGMSPLFSSDGNTRVSGIEDEELAPRPLSPRSPRRRSSRVGVDIKGKGVVGSVGSGGMEGGQLMRGTSKLKWTKTPAPDYTGDGWDDDEWA